VRIALLGTAWPMRGGIAQYNALLARELSKRNAIEFISFTRQYPSLLFPGKTQLDTSEDPLRFPATPLVDSIGPWSWQRTIAHLGRWRPDGLVLKYWMPFFAPAYGWIARGARRTRPRPLDGDRPRVIAILDNLIPHERRLLDSALTRWFMGGVDAYIVQSNVVRDDLLRMAPAARFLEVPHPVYNLFGERIEKRAARAQLRLDPETPLLLFFGFVRPYKGLDVVLDALPLVRRELPAQLLILGEFYGGKADSERHVARLGLQDAVILHDGYVPNEQVGLYFSAADVVVLPYRSATQSGIVPIAWQLERPVICTDVGGLAEVVEHERTGLVVPPANPAALAAAIVRYFREGLEARFMPAISREKLRYSWERMAEAVETLVRG
jgi:D-inositol-3-phosphate glycosyltransferase